MSFLFALLQLTSFGLADLEPAEHPAIEASIVSKADLVQRPIVNPCAGNGCR